MRSPAAFLIALALLALALFPGSSWAGAAEAEHLVSGTVEDLQGVPMASVTVEAQGPGGAVHKATTSSLGSFELSLPEGAYNISAAVAGLAANRTYSLLQVSSAVQGVDFTIQVSTGRVEGHVTSKETPVVGAQVVLSNGNATYLGMTSLPLGSYSIPGVVPGVYVARAEMVGYWTNVSQVPVYVDPLQTAEMDFMLEPQPARIFGKVTVGGSPEEGVSAKLMSGTVEVRTAITDANGNYSFSNIIAGEYEVVFSREGLVEKTYPVSVSPFEELELSVSMVLDGSSGDNGFIPGLDLTHSMMVVALVVVMLVMIFAMFVRMRVMKRPELLAKEEEEKEPSPRKEKK